MSTGIHRFTGEGHTRDVLRGAGTTLFIRLIATGVSYLSILFLARWMGAAEYGAFAYAFAWANFLAMPATLGIPVASVRFISEYSAKESLSHVRGLLTRGLMLIGATSIVISAIAITVVLIAGDRIPDAYHGPLIICLAGLPVIALFTFEAQVGRAFGWLAIAFSPTQIWHPLSLLLVAGIIVSTGHQLIARHMVAISITIAAVCASVQAVVYLAKLRPRLRNIAPLYEVRAWLRVSLPILLIDGFSALMNYSDVLMVGWFVGPKAVAFYTAASRSAGLVLAVYGSMGATSGPRMAELYAKGRRKDLQELLTGIAPWITVPPAVAAVALAVAGPFLLGLFGQGFGIAWPALVLLAFSNLMMSVTGPSALLLNMTGYQDTTARACGVAAIGNVVLNLLLIPRYGITGAAIATTIATVASNIVLVVIAHRKLGLHTSMFSPHDG